MGVGPANVEKLKENVGGGGEITFLPMPVDELEETRGAFLFFQLEKLTPTPASPRGSTSFWGEKSFLPPVFNC